MLVRYPSLVLVLVLVLVKQQAPQDLTAAPLIPLADLIQAALHVGVLVSCQLRQAHPPLRLDAEKTGSPRAVAVQGPGER